MKIIRFNIDHTRMESDTIRRVFNLDTKDKDSETYRCLIPLVVDSDCLGNVIRAFYKSYSNIKDFNNKYSFHCADKEEVKIIESSIPNGYIDEYKEFEYLKALDAQNV